MRIRTGSAVKAIQFIAVLVNRGPIAHGGQLYVNLRGFDHSGSVTSSAEAVREFLDALDVPPQRIPAGLDAQAALYRNLLADRRLLAVLDNARDAEQVRPLLPGSPGYLVLVTSRDQLSSLVAAEGARPLPLDLLTHEESRQLLARRLGAHRVAAEPDAVDDIVTRCARLPLALAIVTARAATNPRFPLRTLAAELGGSHDRLDALASGDPATEMRAVYSWSVNTLSPGAERLFRLLGPHPGPDISAAAAASLSGLSPQQVRPPLAELVRAHLVVEHTPARYSFHDLLREYATELANNGDPHGHNSTAVRRTLDHYLHTAHTAALLLNPHRDPIPLAPPEPGVSVEHLDDEQRALAWFATERLVLLAAVDRAAAAGFDTHAWQLAWTLATFLNRQGHWRDWAATWETALEATRRLADPAAQAIAHRGLGWAYKQLGRHEQARARFLHTLDLHRDVGNQLGLADVHLDLGTTLVLADRHADALRHAQQALDLYRAVGHQTGQALAFNNIGWCHTVLGEYEQGLASCQHALALHQDLGNRDAQAGTWDSIGFAHHHLGHHVQAIGCYQHALDLYRDIGDRFEEATTLTNLGDTHQASGDPDAARDAWRDALAILDELSHPTPTSSG